MNFQCLMRFVCLTKKAALSCRSGQTLLLRLCPLFCILVIYRAPLPVLMLLCICMVITVFCSVCVHCTQWRDGRSLQWKELASMLIAVVVCVCVRVYMRIYVPHTHAHNVCAFSLLRNPLLLKKHT